MDAIEEPKTDERYEQLSTELDEAHKTVAQLTAAVHSNRDIGAAIGILMALRRVTQPQAFDLLRQASQRLHVKLRDLARYVIDTGALPETADDPPVAHRRAPDRSLPSQRSLHQRVSAALLRADLRDAAAATRSAAARARLRAAELRHELAARRAANGDTKASAIDRECELQDRNAEALDNVWTSRDGDEAAGDRDLLSEAARQAR